MIPADASPVQRLALGEEDRDEIRFALAMNGGVSLAVWMGGVTREFDLVRRGVGVYQELLHVTHSTARVDVIAGASAGGINGAVLAAAISNDTTLDAIRELWLTRGSFIEMLRDPLERDPPSLLRGDDFFLPRLREAFRGLEQRPTPAAAKPLRLLITATTLTAKERGYDDDFGSIIADRNHRALFRFRADPSTGRNDFADPEAAEKLALAARTSASFPGAFEPSFIPVGAADASPGRPSMQGIASFGASRWAIDGGVLVNTPVEPLLRAIFSLPASRQVRRVLAIVVPSPGELGPLRPDDSHKLPRILEVATASVSSLPRQQTIGDQLQEIRDYNVRVASRRRRREEFLRGISPASLLELARSLFPIYQRVRDADAIVYVASMVARQVAAGSETDSEAEPTRDELEGLYVTTWNREILETQLARAEKKPWLPTSFPLPADASKAVLEGWDWGLSPVERASVVVLDLLRRALILTPLENLEARRLLQQQRSETHRGAAEVRRLRDRDAAFFTGDARRALDALSHGDADDLRSWADGIFNRWSDAVTPTQVGAVAQLFATVLAASAPTVRRSIDAQTDAGSRLLGMLDRLAPAGATGDDCLLRLLALEVVERALGPDEREPEQPIEVIQISANTPNAFDGRDRAEDKLTGLQLGHFGAFYKTSWRANDWMWGRLDGAARIVQVLLNPARLRQLGYTADEAREAIRHVATGDTPRTDCVLRRSWSDARALEELAFLDHPANPPPESLPYCALAIIRRLHLQIIQDELPTVAQTVRADLDEGGATVAARHWAKRVPTDRELRPEEAVDFFRIADVGRERLPGEVGSDLFTRVSTTAFAAAGSALRSRHSGLIAPVRPVTSALRGVLLASYLLARGAVARNKTGAFLVPLLLAVAGALVAVPLVTGESFGFLSTLAGAVLVGGFLLALIRSGALVVVVLLAAALGGIAWCLIRDHGDDSTWRDCFGWVSSLGPAIPIFVIVLIAVLFGMMSQPAWLTRLKGRRSRRG